MIRAALPLLILALAACSDNGGTDGSEKDFASRVGAGEGTATPAPASTEAAPRATTAPKVSSLQPVGTFAQLGLNVDAGGCSFVDAGRTLLVAAAPPDRTLPGKAAVRYGGKQVVLDAPPGDYARIRAGTTFAGEGFTVTVQPTGTGQAQITIKTPKGDSESAVGDWACS